jgi:hypothetical protein
MGIHDLDQPATHPLASATPRRHRRTLLLGAGAMALVLATIGIIAALAGPSSPAAQAHVPSVTVASPNSIDAASSATRQSPGGQAAPSSTKATPAPPVLEDGIYPTYISEVDVDGARITVDVIQVFEDEAAVNAAIEDGMAPGEARYLYVYIRNENPRLRTLQVAPDLRIEFLGECQAPPNRNAALTELADKTTPFNGTYYYDVTVTDGAIQLITERLAVAAC